MSIMKENDSPQRQINEQSLTQDLEKTRESLKRKLQTRRSLQQLVDVGIIPSPKSSLSLYQQHKQLQMRKTQDILKNKILSRPNRQLLIEHNILSDTTAAPAIQKTQCQLKRARLVDNLNDKLSVRPGILELVANNIFEIDSNLKQAIQNGHIQCPNLSQPICQKTKRLLSKSKSCLTFHEYKGPLQKIEITKVPLKPFEHNHYRNQLRQQQLFLELVQNEDKTIENLFQQSQSFEKMKLIDLKNECKKFNISSTGTKIKLIEKLKNFQIKISSQMINNESSSSSLNDQEIYHKQQQKLIELENQLEKLKQYDCSSTDHPIIISPKCNPILSIQIQKRILLQQQEKLQQKLQKNTIVPLIPESLAYTTNNDVILNLLDENTDSASFSDHFYSNPSSLNYMDWMTIPSPPIIIDNNPDFTQFDIDHHFLFDSIYQQQNTLSFDLFSSSSSII